MTHRHPSLICAAALLLLAACDDGSGDGTDAGGDDAGAGLEPSTLFGECEVDSQCPGEGAICRLAVDGYPRGFCTVPCEDRTPCDIDGVYHHCATREGEDQSYCERRCLNGLDCRRPEYTCAGELPPSGGFCIGVCSSDEDCGGDAVCDPYTAVCADSVVEVGAVTGEPCADSDACRSGQCQPEEDAAGLPTGWVGGYCLSTCILPRGYNPNSFYDGDAFPNGGCPGTAVCLPADFANTAMRDLGRCYSECVEDTDCRGGYTCLKEFALSSGGTSVYSNGICVPHDCATEGCPDGYTCQTVERPGQMPVRRCGR